MRVATALPGLAFSLPAPSIVVDSLVLPRATLSCYVHLAFKGRPRGVALDSTPVDDPDILMSDDPMIVRLEEECAQLNGGDWNERELPFSSRA